MKRHNYDVQHALWCVYVCVCVCVCVRARAAQYSEWTFLGSLFSLRY